MASRQTFFALPCIQFAFAAAVARIQWLSEGDREKEKKRNRLVKGIKEKEEEEEVKENEG